MPELATKTDEISDNENGPDGLNGSNGEDAGHRHIDNPDSPDSLNSDRSFDEDGINAENANPFEKDRVPKTNFLLS